MGKSLREPGAAGRPRKRPKDVRKASERRHKDVTNASHGEKSIQPDWNVIEIVKTRERERNRDGEREKQKKKKEMKKIIEDECGIKLERVPIWWRGFG